MCIYKKNHARMAMRAKCVKVQQTFDLHAGQQQQQPELRTISIAPSRVMAMSANKNNV